MSRRLPPLNQLRAFEAAARHLSFKTAADELNVTHAAISHHIRALEEFLQAQLFQREARGVRLTSEAEELAEGLRQALDQMDQAVSKFEAHDMTGTLKVSVVPWYGNRLILPNLPDFHGAHPGLEIELGYSYETVDLPNSDYHAALRHGVGNWPQLDAKQVHRDLVTPLCAPDFVAGLELPLSPQAIAGLPLAVGQGYKASWQMWFEGAGVPASEDLKFIEFDNRALASEFAMAGNGVCLPDLLAMQLELQSGQLIRMHSFCLELETGNHLVFPKTPYPDPRLTAFADWLERLFSAKRAAAEAAGFGLTG